MTEIITSRHRVSDGQEIQLATAGKGPAVVFLHGSGPGASGVSNFRGNIDAFVEAGYRVILPDLIGYGESSKPEDTDYTLELFTSTVREALREHGVDRAAFVGNSLGGGIAIQLALDEPDFVSSLVLMAPGCVAEQASYFTMPGIAKMKSSFGSPDFSLEEQRRLVGNLVHPDFAKNIPDALVEERFAVAKTQPKDVLMRMKTPDLSPRLGELDCPVFVLWGLNDEFCPVEHSALFLERCANARTVTFGRTGHWVQVERVNEFNRYATEFLHECG
ncbi:alpha/beta hydrolase [Erythrobacter alti]|uniref:alpha/beta fold hydrolase n=1 Tax=Erythrobacter alti TaxID=1896145 RepID=UPI0030F43E3E